MFNIFKKKDKCSCGTCACESKRKDNDLGDKASIIILGPGCKKCKQLEENVRKALDAIPLTASVGHVTDMVKIASYGVMQTPALVIYDKLEPTSVGKVLKVEEIVKLLK